MTAPAPLVRDVTERDTSILVGLSLKTLARYREERPDRSAVPFDKRAGRYFYNVREVQEWMLFHGLQSPRPGGPAAAPSAAAPSAAAPPAAAPAAPPAAAPPARVRSLDFIPLVPERSAPAFAPDQSAVLDAKNRQNMRTAELAQKALKAEKQKRDLDIEKGLTELGLDRKIRAASTLTDVSALSTEVAALTAQGKVSHSTGRVLRELLTEKRQNLKAEAKERREASEAKVDRAILCQQEDTPELVRAFEGIIDDARRARVMRYVAAVAEEDIIDSPKADTGEPAQDKGP